VSFAIKMSDISVPRDQQLLKPEADAIFGNTGQGTAELVLNAMLVSDKSAKPLRQPCNISLVGRPDTAIGLPSEALDQLDQHGASVGLVARDLDDLRRGAFQDRLRLFDCSPAAR
jgi:hypothetical protein